MGRVREGQAMNNLKITIIQSNLHWENIDKNLEMFAQKISSVTEETDLIVLPEMFTTGFSMQPQKLAEQMNGKTLIWLKQQAEKKQCVVTGSFICEENGKYYNRIVWMKPDGTYSVYDKRHLFSMAEEDKHYTAGDKKIIEEIKGWKICPLVCYDLRFPVWSRNTNKNRYDVLIYIANWPERRAYPWKTLLLARAIENQSYVVGLNRVGNDGNEIYHSGDSAIVNAKGEIISTIKPHEEKTETITLEYKDLEDFKKQFPVMDDADEFNLLT